MANKTRIKVQFINGYKVKNHYYRYRSLKGKYFVKGLVSWYKDNALSKDGPSNIYYYKSGKIHIQKWCLNNKLHRDNGPAYIHYYENGSVESEVWFDNNLLHNENGPAIIDYSKNDEIVSKRYYIKDNPYTEEEFEKYKLIKNLSGIGE